MKSTIAIDRYVFDTLMRDLIGHDRRAASYLIYLSILNAGGGKAVALSYQQLAARAGLSKRTVQDAVAHLAKRGLVAVDKGARTEPASLTPLSPWHR